MHITDFKLLRSPLFNSLLVSIVIASNGILLSLPLGWFLKAAIMLLTAAYGLSIIWQHGLLKGKNSLVSLSKNQTVWHIATRDAIFSAELCGDSTITTLVSILKFRTANSKTLLSCVIFCDALPTNNQYRHLIVQLRTSHAQQSEKMRRSLPTA
jgi:hypothetical protein